MKTLFIGLFLAVSAQGSSLAELVERKCGIYEGEISDWAICPKVEKFTFRKLTLPKAEAFLKDKQGLNPERTSAKRAVEVIRQSLQGQVSTLWDTLLEGEDNLAEAAQGFVNSVPLILKVFENAARGKVVYSDPDTYWAPSVNARAMAIVDLKKGTIHVILHGDTDG